MPGQGQMTKPKARPGQAQMTKQKAKPGQGQMTKVKWQIRVRIQMPILVLRKVVESDPTILTLVYGITKRDSSGYNRMNGVA